MTALRALAAALLLALALPLAAAPSPSDPEYDQYGGWRRFWANKTGFFHIEQVRGRYWLVNPEGNVFLCKAFSLPPGADYSLVPSLAFNAVCGPAPAGVPYTISLEIGAAAVAAEARVTDRFPDVFDPRFAEAARRQVAALCAPRVQDPLCLGYFTDQDLGWAPVESGLADLVDAYLRLPDGAPGRQQLLRLLAERYQDDLARFNRTWGTSLESFCELGRRFPLRVGHSCDARATVADRSYLMSAIVDRYLQLTRDAVREVDTNHLLLGPVFHEWVPAEAAPLLAKTVDVVSLRAPLFPPPANLIGQLYRDCTKPMLIAGFTGGRSPQDYRKYLQRLAEIPFVLGYQWSGPGARTQTGPPTFSLPPISTELREAVYQGNRGYYQLADWGRLRPAFWRIDRRYEVVRSPYPIVVDGALGDWQQARPETMELAVSPYCRTDGRVSARAYLMWDAGHVYVAGELLDPNRRRATLTAAVGTDWLELQAGPYSYAAELRPGRPPGDDKVRIASRALWDEASRSVIGYCYETAARLPVVVPVGFRFNCGLALHHYTPDGGEIVLSFPANYTRFDPKSAGEVVLAGPRQQERKLPTGAVVNRHYHR